MSAADRLVVLPDGRHEIGYHRDGLPTFRFGAAPSGLATRRQLRARGLCPGRHGIVAQLVWARGGRWAGLYDLNHARPSRTPTPAQRDALAAAMRARRTCKDCHRLFGFCLPRSEGTRCWDCHQTDDTDFPTAA